MRSLSSSNPVLNNGDAFQEFYGSTAVRSDTASVQGVVNKTALLCGIAVIAGSISYSVLPSFPSLMWISAISAFVICLGFGFIIAGKPHLAKIAGPLYAIVEGVFLGALTAVADSILAAKGIAAFAGVGVQAFVVTAAALVSMLILYKTGIVRPTAKLKAFLGVATLGIFLAYGLSFVMSLITGSGMPLISFGAAAGADGASPLMAFAGLGVCLLIFGIASLTLVMDFERVEQVVASGGSKDMEWFCAFGLLVTLAWIYYEAVKIVIYVASIANRE